MIATTVGLGLAMGTLSGVLLGSFALPMKACEALELGKRLDDVFRLGAHCAAVVLGIGHDPKFVHPSCRRFRSTRWPQFSCSAQAGVWPMWRSAWDFACWASRWEWRSFSA